AGQHVNGIFDRKNGLNHNKIVRARRLHTYLLQRGHSSQVVLKPFSWINVEAAPYARASQIGVNQTSPATSREGDGEIICQCCLAFSGKRRSHQDDLQGALLVTK